VQRARIQKLTAILMLGEGGGDGVVGRGFGGGRRKRKREGVASAVGGALEKAEALMKEIQFRPYTEPFRRNIEHIHYLREVRNESTTTPPS